MKSKKKKKKLKWKNLVLESFNKNKE
jgi:hypothetical protein